MHFYKNSSGFTLISVMIVVAIIGILAAIAYPNYMDYVRQSRRQEAIAAMRVIQLAEEDYFVKKGNYYFADDTESLINNLGLSGVDSLDSAKDYYRFKVKKKTNNYRIIANAKSHMSQAEDVPCTVLKMDKIGPYFHSKGKKSCWPG